MHHGNCSKKRKYNWYLNSVEIHSSKEFGNSSGLLTEIDGLTVVFTAKNVVLFILCFKVEARASMVETESCRNHACQATACMTQ